MLWVPAMIFDVSYKVAILVGDLYIPYMLSDSPIRDHQVSAAQQRHMSQIRTRICGSGEATSCIDEQT